MGDSDEIIVPRKALAGAKDWHITNSRLKLALKYGIVGPWGPLRSNPSVVFDTYALSRGPKSGLPNLSDLAMTQLMNSNVGGGDLGTLNSWLAERRNRKALEKVQIALGRLKGLHNAREEVVREVGRFVDSILNENANGVRVLRGIQRAKAFKWLSAWAPAHIPMIDSYVEGALRDIEGGESSAEVLLVRFQKLLCTKNNLAALIRLGEWLGKSAKLPVPVPPVRVLDSLLWGDWGPFWQRQRGPFRKWLIPHNKNDPKEVKRTERGLTKAGESLLRQLL